MNSQGVKTLKKSLKTHHRLVIFERTQVFGCVCFRDGFREGPTGNRSDFCIDTKIQEKNLEKQRRKVGLSWLFGASKTESVQQKK